MFKVHEVDGKVHKHVQTDLVGVGPPSRWQQILIRLELGSQNPNARKHEKLLRLNKWDSNQKTARKNENNLRKQQEPTPRVRKYK